MAIGSSYPPLPRADPQDLSAVHDILVALAFRAGEVLLSFARARTSCAFDSFCAAEKTSNVDIVTEADELAESVVLEGLREAFGAVGIESGKDAWDGAKVRVVAEEAYGRSGDKRCLIDARPTFVIDPLDGTVNFTHLFPSVCVALGYCIDNRPVVGVTYAPFMTGSLYNPLPAPGNTPSVSPTGGIMWSSVQGRGAWQTPVSFIYNPPSFPRPTARSILNGSRGLKTPFPIITPAANTVGRWGLDPAYYTIDALISRAGLHQALQSLPSISVAAAAAAGADATSPVSLPPPMRLPLTRNPAPFPKDAPKGCLIVAEWGKDRREVSSPWGPVSNLSRKLESLQNLASAVGTRSGKGGAAHGIRSCGSSALDIIQVACGTADIMWEGGCWEWDVTAGIATLLEAGGYVVDSSPPTDPESSLWKPETPLPPARLGGRRYLAVRACAVPYAGEDEKFDPELALRKEQERVIREVWKRVVGLAFERPE